MILLIDNYDSFTYNLYQAVGVLTKDIAVARNDEITIDEIEKMSPAAIIISPGPGYPKDAGISEEVIKTFSGRIPILGVCLGHQAIAEAFGGKIVHAKQQLHGKQTDINLNTCLLNDGINGLSSLTNDITNLLRINLHRDDLRCIFSNLCSRLSNSR